MQEPISKRDSHELDQRRANPCPGQAVAAAIAIALVAGAGGTALGAESVADFYKGKTVTMHIGYPPGGGYDAYSRTIARHMGRHIPGNPSFKSVNRPGAGSRRLTNELYNILPQDGTAIGMIDRGTALEALFGSKQAKYDPLKFNWIGSANNEVSTCVTWHTTGVDTIDEFLTKKLKMGGSGPGAGPDILTKVVNNVIGANLDLITGYPGGNNINIAMERGEIDGRCGWSLSSMRSTRPDWLKDNKVNVVLQLSTAKHPDLAKQGVPWIMDLAKTKRQKQIMTLLFAREAMGRPVVTGPKVPPARVKALREAFMATMKDEKFLADLKKQRLDAAPLSGQEVQDLVATMMNTSPEIVQAAKEATEKTGNMYIKKITIPMVEHEGKVSQVKRGGRRVYIMHDGKEVRAKLSGSRTAVTIDGDKTKRSKIKAGMTCKFTYPGPGSEAKRVDCKN